VPTEVRSTPRADQQIERLDRRQRRTLDRFLDELAAQGCRALGYRLTGTAPMDHICVKHLDGTLRVVVAFETADLAWILLVGPHEDSDPVLDVYTELYRLLGAAPPDAERRTKPPCCEEPAGSPPALGDALADILDRATQVRRTRRTR